MRLREQSSFGHTLTISNANGARGYLPSEDQICRSGYEVDQFIDRHIFSLADDTDANIIKQNLEIIEKIEQ